MKGIRRAHLGSTNTIFASSSSSSSSPPFIHQGVKSRSASVRRCFSGVPILQALTSRSAIGDSTSKRHSESSKSISLGILRLPRLSWFQILCRWFPLFLIFTTTTPLSLGMYKSSGPAASSNIVETTTGHSCGSSSKQESSGNIINRSHGKDNLNHNSLDNGQSDDDNNNKMTIPGLSEEDQKFLDRVQSSLRTVQNWDASTELFQECRTQIPWKDLNNATGPYSNPEQDRLLQGNANALFLQRLCRWFPKFMSWVNTPPCQVCGCKECEMKTVRGPETEEEKEGQARRVEGELFQSISIAFFEILSNT
jgi:hypothetical protein